MDSVRISSEPLFHGTISPLIYGDFVEFIDDLIPAMWAEKVRDRCFEGPLQPRMLWRTDEDWTIPRWRTFVAGQPAARPPADGLEMVHPRVSLMLDQYSPFAGRQSALVRVESGDERPFVAGISQGDIAVRKGQRLAFEMYVRGRHLEDTPVQVLLGRSYGVFFKTYARLAFDDIGEGWQRCAGSLVSEVTDEHAELAIGISAPGGLLARQGLVDARRQHLRLAGRRGGGSACPVSGDHPLWRIVSRLLPVAKRHRPA